MVFGVSLGNTAAQAMEEQRRRRHELETHALGLERKRSVLDNMVIPH